MKYAICRRMSRSGWSSGKVTGYVFDEASEAVSAPADGQGGTCHKQEMALETGVSLRTVKTDMAKLNELLKDYDVHIMSKPGAGYRLVPNGGVG